VNECSPLSCGVLPWLDVAKQTSGSSTYLAMFARISNALWIINNERDSLSVKCTNFYRLEQRRASCLSL
jgi:hypothetical protein